MSAPLLHGGRMTNVTVIAQPSQDDLGHDVWLNSQFIGHRPYDGKDIDDVCDEVIAALARTIGKELNWTVTSTEEEI